MRKVACVYTTQIKRKAGTEICSGPCFHYTIDERRDSCFRKGRKCERNPSGVSFAFNSRPQATVCAAERFRTNKKRHAKACLFLLVREMRLELTRRLPHAPQTCLSTYSSTLAYCAFLQCQIIIIANAAFVNHIFSELSSLRASYGARKAVDRLFPSLYNGGMQILRGCRMAAPILSGAVCRAGRALRRLPRRTSITMLPPVVLVPVCRLHLEVFL